MSSSTLGSLGESAYRGFESIVASKGFHYVLLALSLAAVAGMLGFVFVNPLVPFTTKWVVGSAVALFYAIGFAIVSAGYDSHY